MSADPTYAESDHADQLTLDGVYDLLEVLGEGSMGTVYLAWQRSVGREVAIKVLRPELCADRDAIRRFAGEARAASKLTHPHTITIHDFGQTADGALYIAMERLWGHPLSATLDDEGRFEPLRAARLAVQLCHALAHAHEVGIVHRDLKPDNVFLVDRWGVSDFVKVLDFGIAKMLEPAPRATAITHHGMVCGTPEYMSPEQAAGKPIDGRSDLYAVGILLYELLAGRRPFDHPATLGLMRQQIAEPPPALPEAIRESLPAGLEQLVYALLAKSPERRPASAQAVAARLTAILERADDPSCAHPPAPASPRRRDDRRGVRRCATPMPPERPFELTPPKSPEHDHAETRDRERALQPTTPRHPLPSRLPEGWRSGTPR